MGRLKATQSTQSIAAVVVELDTENQGEVILISIY